MEDHNNNSATKNNMSNEKGSTNLEIKMNPISPSHHNKRSDANNSLSKKLPG